ncbi:hypothetical protein LLG96_19785, partial [bacterium]|nr:hypothetical protein [bacterium]
MKKSTLYVLCVVMALALFSCAKPPELPGPTKAGTLLPNRWVLTPAGTHLPVGDLPLNMSLSPDGKLLAVTNNGFSRQFISLIDTEQDSIAGELPVEKGFYGLTFSSDGKYLYASGGGDEQVLVWRISGLSAVQEPSISL